MSFWSEIKQRRITQIVVTYLAGGWIVTSVVDQVGHLADVLAHGLDDLRVLGDGAGADPARDDLDGTL